jgi:hypothetical protein
MLQDKLEQADKLPRNKQRHKHKMLLLAQEALLQMRRQLYNEPVR